MEPNFITDRQLHAIDELFASGGDENAVLRKFSISLSKWKRWRSQQPFNKALEAKMKTLNQNGQMLLLQHSSLASARLLELCNSQKEEVSRKACLNVLQLNSETVEKNTSLENSQSNEPEKTHLTTEQASKILAVLSEDLSSRP
jgi:cystathionine beta-lyase/cystathionine gamma-synthase